MAPYDLGPCLELLSTRHRLGVVSAESKGQVGKRRITIQAVHREHIDTKELARLFLMVAEEQARKEKEV